MKQEYRRHRAKIIVFAYILPFLAIGIAMWSYQQQREDRSKHAAIVLSETREAVLLNCQQIEAVKAQLVKTLREQIAVSRENLERFRVEKPDLYPILKDQFDRGLVRQYKVIARFAPINCQKIPFVNRGKNPLGR